MKVDEILMIIIGILSLIILYKIMNSGLVEGAVDDCNKAIEKSKCKAATSEKSVITCSDCLAESPLSEWEKKGCSLKDLQKYCKIEIETREKKEFCSKSPEDQWETCRNLTKENCSRFGEGCKWTSEQASGLGWAQPGTGRNTYPGCMVNCAGCNNTRSIVDNCEGLSVENCDKRYEVPFVGNTKLCINSRPAAKWLGDCTNGGVDDDDKNDIFCARQRLSLVCDEQDDDGFCYTSGDQ